MRGAHGPLVATMGVMEQGYSPARVFMRPLVWVPPSPFTIMTARSVTQLTLDCQVVFAGLSPYPDLISQFQLSLDTGGSFECTNTCGCCVSQFQRSELRLKTSAFWKAQFSGELHFYQFELPTGATQEKPCRACFEETTRKGSDVVRDPFLLFSLPVGKLQTPKRV